MADKNAGKFWGMSFNPATGCDDTYPCYARCHARNMARRFAKGDPDYFAPRFHPERLEIPLRRKKPTVWFVGLAGDLFAEGITDEQILQVFEVMRDTPHHTYLVCTKRVERMASFAREYVIPLPLFTQRQRIYLGCSVMTQEDADRYRDDMMALAEAGWKTWANHEPAIGAVDWTGWMPGMYAAEDFTPRGPNDIVTMSPTPGLSQLIAGGETGPQARPCHPDWIRSDREQAEEAGIPFFFKSWGEWFPREMWEDNPLLELPDDEDSYREVRGTQVLNKGEYGETIVHRVGHKRSGRMLDGHAHDQLAWRTE
jgi:protein gp37